MIGRVSDAIKPIATLEAIGILSALFALFAVVFQVLGRKIRSHSGGIGPLDTQFYYSAERANATLAAQGEQGRRLYRSYNLVDFLFPPVYALLMAASITHSFQRLFGRDSAALRLNLIPLLLAAIDYLENACISALLAAYPRRRDRLATAAGFLTATKTILLLLGLLLIAAGLVGSMIKAALSKRT
jgi:hypothetical protein